MRRERFVPRGPVALAPKAWGEEFEVLIAVEDVGAAAPFTIVADGAFAVVTIDGPLVHHEHPFWDNYDAIRGRVGAAFASTAKGVLLKIDSPGGDVAGCFELARDLRAMARATGKSLVSYVDGMAASAAYALACSADRVYVPPTGYVGSIGCIDAMCDQTAADAQMGVRYALVASGARKTDGNPHVQISKDAVESLQMQVDGLAALFFELVEEMRGIPPAKTRAMQAALYFGGGAVDAKLADAVKTFSEVLASAAVGNQQGEEAMSYVDDAKKALKKAIDEGGDEKAKKFAKKMLDAIHAIEDGGDVPEKKDESDVDEKKDVDSKAAKAEDSDGDDDKSKKAEAEDDTKKAQASAGGFDLAREFHALKAKLDAKERAEAVASLFAQRPDFDDRVRATLSAMSLEKIREAVETWPRIAAPAPARAAAIGAVGTRGRTQTGDPSDVPVVPPAEADFIDRAMGLKPLAGVIKRERNTLELGVMTPDQARAKVEELSKKGAA